MEKLATVWIPAYAGMTGEVIWKLKIVKLNID